MHITGQCHCGHVRYEADIDPERVSICHCTDCQRLTGSAFRLTVTTETERFRITGNPPKRYEKRGDNGKLRLQFFCPECGSPIYTTGEGEDAGIVGIRQGTIDQRRQLIPRRQIWCQSIMPWLAGTIDLPASPRD